MFLWCERDEWRDIYSERGLLLPGASGCQRLHSLASSSEMPLIGCMYLARLRFSVLCLNLTAWFSSRGLLPVTHLSYPTALIMLSSSCLLIKMWQFAKAHGVTRKEPKIHVICYITVPVMLELWGMRRTPSFPFLPHPTWSREVIPDRVLPMGQVDLNCVLMLNWIAWNGTAFVC